MGTPDRCIPGEGIEVVPTLVVYKGGEVLGSLVAPESKARIDAFLTEVLA